MEILVFETSLATCPVSMCRASTASIVSQEKYFPIAARCDLGCHAGVLRSGHEACRRTDAGDGTRHNPQDRRGTIDEMVHIYLPSQKGLFITGQASSFLLQCAAVRRGLWRGMRRRRSGAGSNSSVRSNGVCCSQRSRTTCDIVPHAIETCVSPSRRQTCGGTMRRGIVLRCRWRGSMKQLTLMNRAGWWAGWNRRITQRKKDDVHPRERRVGDVGE